MNNSAVQKFWTKIEKADKHISSANAQLMHFFSPIWKFRKSQTLGPSPCCVDDGSMSSLRSSGGSRGLSEPLCLAQQMFDLSCARRSNILLQPRRSCQIVWSDSSSTIYIRSHWSHWHRCDWRSNRSNRLASIGLTITSIALASIDDGPRYLHAQPYVVNLHSPTKTS